MQLDEVIKSKGKKSDIKLLQGAKQWRQVGGKASRDLWAGLVLYCIVASYHCCPVHALHQINIVVS